MYCSSHSCFSACLKTYQWLISECMMSEFEREKKKKSFKICHYAKGYFSFASWVPSLLPFFVGDPSTHGYKPLTSAMWHPHTKVYPKVSGLAACSENCKWYSSLPLCADVSLFCESVLWLLLP
jgi:hypothetical protein